MSFKTPEIPRICSKIRIRSIEETTTLSRDGHRGLPINYVDKPYYTNNQDEEKEDEDEECKSNQLSQQYDFSGVCGLQNPGNYCYMNTVVQCLFHTQLFSDFFENNLYRKFLTNKTTGVAKEFTNLLKGNNNDNDNQSCHKLRLLIAKKAS